MSWRSSLAALLALEPIGFDSCKVRAVKHQQCLVENNISGRMSEQDTFINQSAMTLTFLKYMKYLRTINARVKYHFRNAILHE